MVHFEFGQDRLTQPHPLKAFELAQGAIKGAFVLFSTPLLGLVGFVLQNHFLVAERIFLILRPIGVDARVVPSLLTESDSGDGGASASVEQVEFSRAFRAAWTRSSSSIVYSARLVAVEYREVRSRHMSEYRRGRPGSGCSSASMRP
jgi:hypothetical protein